MKKLKILGSLIIAASMLSGCGIDKQNEVVAKVNQKENVQLKVWGPESDQELLTEMIKGFKVAHEDEATFEITVESESEESCKTRILENVNEAADVFTFADDQLRELAAAGVVENIKFAEEVKTANGAGSVEAATINDKIYAYPMTADNGYFMFYNKAYLSEDDVKSMDKILAVASSLNKKVTMDWTGWYMYSFFGNTGLTLTLNPDGITNFCDWNSTDKEIKGVDVGNAMLAMAKNPGFMSGGDDALIAGAKNDSVIAGITGVWATQELQEAWGDNLGATKLPTYTVAGKQVQMSSYAGYKMIGVNAYSKEKEWAAELAHWLTNEENQLLRFKERGLGPSNIAAASNEAVAQSPAIQALIAQSEHASLQRVGVKYWDAAYHFASAILEGTATKDNMQELMNKLVKETTQKVTD